MREAIIGSRATDDFAPHEIPKALRAGYRAFYLAEPDNPLPEPIDLDDFATSGGFLGFRGPGMMQANIQKAFTGAPMFKSVKNAWMLHLRGVSFQGCNLVDDAPLTEFHYIDGGHVENTSWQCGGGVGAFWPGTLSQTPFIGCEFSANGREGFLSYGARNVSFTNECRAERNGRTAPHTYADMKLVAGDQSELGVSLVDCHFEHDEQDHLGLHLVGGVVDVIRPVFSAAGFRAENVDLQLERPRKAFVVRWEIITSEPVRTKKSGWWPF